MGRRPARDLIKRVLKSLSDSPRTVQEIARDAESNWGSVREYLESLKEAGIVLESSVGGRKMFSLAQNFAKERSENYFDLPVIARDDELICSLFSRIKYEWEKATGGVPGKVQIQKSLWRVNKLCKLNLPIGWYLFGSLCVKPYDPHALYEFKGVDGETEKCISETVAEYSREPSAYSLKIRQYREENSKLYKTKELIISLLMSPEFSRKNVNEINRLFYDFLNSLPEISDEDSKRLVNEFAGVVFQLVNSLPEEELNHVKPDMLQAFNEVWKLVALYRYSGDLRNYYETNYDKNILRKHFTIDMRLQKQEVVKHASDLVSLVPPIKEPSDPVYQKLKSILGKGRLLSKEESNQKERELKKMSSSDLFRKFGLD